MSSLNQFCQSCGLPLSAPEAQGGNEKYCAYCCNSDGNLKSWEETLSGLTEFLDSWQQVGQEEAQKRAKRYLTAMPAWAHKADD